MPALVALLVTSRYVPPGYSDRRAWVQSPGSPGHFCQVYSGICFDIKISGRHKGFDSVIFKLWLLANTGFRGTWYWSLLESLVT